ncbi:MAG: hypothetical protein ABJG15_00390 [Hyphomonadaceae bacterium]
MTAVFGYGLVTLALLAFVLPIFARGWRSFGVLLAISLLASIGSWADFYINTLDPDKFIDVSAVWSQMSLSGLTALMIGTAALAIMRLKSWPRVDNIWMARAARALAFGAILVASFYAVAFTAGVLTQDKYKAAWCAQHDNPEQCVDAASQDT